MGGASAQLFLDILLYFVSIDKQIRRVAAAISFFSRSKAMKHPFAAGRRGHWALGLAIAFVVGLVGCLKLPLGNAETSKMDPQYVGLWMNQEKNGDDSELYAVIPYDARTYL